MSLFVKNPNCNFWLFLRRVDQSPIIICVALGSCSILTTGRGEVGGGGWGGWHTVSPRVNAWCLSLLAPGNDRGAIIYRGNSVSNIGLHWGGIYGAWAISDRLTCTNQLLPTSSWALPQHLAPSTHRSLINLFLTSISSTQSCPFHAAVQITFHPPPPPSSIPSDHGELAITCEGNQSVIESRVRCHVIGDRIIGTGSLCCPEPDAP